MTTTLYTITNITNLHVGSGDINFDIIDNQVQKDSVTTLPIIHSSSLKGALREHYEKKLEQDSINHIFGNSDKQAGNYSFFEAKLLSRPVRSNKKAYFNATTPSIIKNLLQTIEQLNIQIDPALKADLQKLSTIKVKENKPLIFENIQNVILEELEATYHNFDTTKLKKLLGENIALFNEKDLKELDLPVIARNKLNNGKSENLWYEEVVPAQSKFYFIVLKDKAIEKFDEILENDLIQIGANKSIGYGFSKIERV